MPMGGDIMPKVHIKFRIIKSSFALSAIIALIISAMLNFTGPAFAETQKSVTISGVFDPDLAEVTNISAVKSAADTLGSGVSNTDRKCYPANIQFSILTEQGDPTFSDILAKARTDALQAALTQAGVDPGQFQINSVIGKVKDGDVKASANTDDRDAPRLKVTSTPSKGSKVKAGDKIAVTITASERYEDGHRSKPTGVQMIQLISNTDGLVDSKQFGRPPDPCARQSVQITYTVPSNPPPIVHLHALAEDAVGHQSGEDGDFPTKGDYFGTLAFKSQQRVPSGMQYFTGRFDITLTRDGNGNLSGTLSGSQSERLEVAKCPSDTVSPGNVSIKLNGALKDGDAISLDASNGSSTKIQMSPCPGGGQPASTVAVYMWPHFSQVFHDLQKNKDGAYIFDHEWSNSGGGYPYTEHYSLKIEPTK